MLSLSEAVPHSLMLLLLAIAMSQQRGSQRVLHTCMYLAQRTDRAENGDGDIYDSIRQVMQTKHYAGEHVLHTHIEFAYVADLLSRRKIPRSKCNIDKGLDGDARFIFSTSFCKHH
ncbi:hypothetical protein J3F84DRAFT_285453 [Trichoderma pleuroticola]